MAPRAELRLWGALGRSAERLAFRVAASEASPLRSGHMDSRGWPHSGQAGGVGCSSQAPTPGAPRVVADLRDDLGDMAKGVQGPYRRVRPAHSAAMCTSRRGVSLDTCIVCPSAGAPTQPRRQSSPQAVGCSPPTWATSPYHP